ncbi:MAG: putative endonuclease [Pseudonocardiales bacterium]|nr:putative endonuclease [Pseudonocardiales bacterium]
MNSTVATQVQPIAALRLAMDGLRDEDIADLSAGSLGDQLIDLGALAARLAHEQARRAVAFDASGGPLADGFLSGAAWLRSNTVAPPALAADFVRVGRALRDRLPATSAALRAGQFGFEAATAIVRAARDIRDPDVLSALDETLSEIAPTLAPSQIPQAARRILEHLDPELLQRDAAQRHADRSFTLSPMLDGAMSLHGQLDEEGAAVLLSALAPMTTPRGAEDTRTAAQRRADALVELVTESRRGRRRRAGDRHGTAADADRPRRPRNSGRTRSDRALRPRPKCRSGRSKLPEVAARPGGSRLGRADPQETLERIGCGAQTIRLVTDGPSRVLDLGRSRRLARSAQRIALAFRDRGCRFPGCDRPAQWTDIHHVQPWALGGSTDLADLLSFCRFHHRLFHEGGWRLARIADGYEVHDRQGVHRYRIMVE